MIRLAPLCLEKQEEQLSPPPQLTIVPSTIPLDINESNANSVLESDSKNITQS